MEDIGHKIEEIKINNDSKSTIKNTNTSNEKQRNNVSIFSAITDFISCIAETYANSGKFHELELYQVLIENTRIVHKEQINHHISLFRDYFRNNMDCILEKDLTKLSDSNIQYSEKVYINLKSIVDISTDDDKKIILEHMMVLVALLCPEEERVMDIIKKATTTSSSPATGSNLFETIFKQVNDSIANSGGDDENPMALLGNLLQSDFMNNIVDSIGSNLENNNNLDLSDMMQSLTGMISSVTNNLPQNGTQK